MNSSLLRPFETSTAASSEGEITSFQNAAGHIKPDEVQQGKRLFKGRFQIVRRLGRGGFGTTYLAQDVSAQQPMPCVIKQLKYKIQPAQLTGQPGKQNAKVALAQERLQRRFQREARMMARLGRHNQLPCLLEHFTDGDQFYLVQEHIPGLTLGQEMRRSGPHSEQQVKQFLHKMLPIVRYIHQQNLLHLDIKPANIIRRSSDQDLVLIDFGAVCRYPHDELFAGKQRDRGTGTVGFAPAEQLSGQPTYASDIYALGITALYLLTKISPLDLATAPRGQNLRWQESVSLSPHFTQILSKMLHPDATRRFQSIDQLDRAMNLENHYEDLKPCLTTEALKVTAKPKACAIETYARSGDRSQAERQAASIRRWQQRRREFKVFTPK